MTSVDKMDELAAPNGSDWVVRLGLRFGVGVGMLCAVWLLGLHLTGSNAFGPKRLPVQFVVPLAVVASQWMLHRKLAPGKPGLGRALGVGGLTALVAAGMAAGSLYGLGQGVGEGAMRTTRAELQQIARAEHEYIAKQTGGEAGYRRHLAQLERLTLTDLAQNDFSKILLLGLIFGLPGGVFLRE